MKVVKRNDKSKFILIDLSVYNVPSIANVLFGYGVYMLFSSIDLGLESTVAMTAFKYLNRL